MKFYSGACKDAVEIENTSYTMALGCQPLILERRQPWKEAHGFQSGTNVRRMQSFPVYVSGVKRHFTVTDSNMLSDGTEVALHSHSK
jgi:hypothetical protein